MRAKSALLSVPPLLLVLATVVCPVCQLPGASFLSQAKWTTISNGNDVRQVAFDEHGALWAATSGGVVRWNLADGTYTKYTTADGLVDNEVNGVAVAPDGALWFATDGGVSRLKGQRWQSYTEADGLNSDWVNDVAVGPDGTLWSAGYGISRFDGQS
jgi:ligand-binding sensor domain-containing protein